MTNIFEKIMSVKSEKLNLINNGTEINSIEKKAFKNKTQSESEIGKIKDIEDKIKNIQQAIKEDRQLIMSLDGRSVAAVEQIAELRKKKELLEVSKNDKKWLIKNN